ncbi:hypothetical protein VTI74DRAFT_9424 [Chaetomium olivicolor]
MGKRGRPFSTVAKKAAQWMLFKEVKGRPLGRGSGTPKSGRVLSAQTSAFLRACVSCWGGRFLLAQPCLLILCKLVPRQGLRRTQLARKRDPYQPSGRQAQMPSLAGPGLTGRTTGVKSLVVRRTRIRGQSLAITPDTQVLPSLGLSCVPSARKSSECSRTMLGKRHL